MVRTHILLPSKMKRCVLNLRYRYAHACLLLLFLMLGVRVERFDTLLLGIVVLELHSSRNSEEKVGCWSKHCRGRVEKEVENGVKLREL